MGSPRFETTSVPGFQLVRAWFPPGAVLPRHTHDRTNVLMMLRGSFVLGIGGRDIDCERATLAIEPIGEPHANQIGASGAEVLVVQPDPAGQQHWQPFAASMESMRHGRNLEAHDTARRLTRELRTTDGVSCLAQEALAMELLVHALRLEPGAARRVPPWLPRVEEMLRDAAGVPTLAEVAREVGHHPVHVARAFRRHYGTSIGAWVRRQRLERAAQRLMTTEDSVAMVAASLGFCDQSHFTRQFQRLFGRAPAAFRRAGPGRQ
jgi:AraC family transcriptional regulator